MLIILSVTFQAKFMEGVKEVCTTQFLSAVAELCHMDTSLAEWVWLQLFPRIWKVLSEKQQQVCEYWLLNCMVIFSYQLNKAKKNYKQIYVPMFLECSVVVQETIPLHQGLLRVVLMMCVCECLVFCLDHCGRLLAWYINTVNCQYSG